RATSQLQDARGHRREAGEEARATGKCGGAGADLLNGALPVDGAGHRKISGAIEDKLAIDRCRTATQSSRRAAVAHLKRDIGRDVPAPQEAAIVACQDKRAGACGTWLNVHMSGSAQA